MATILISSNERIVVQEAFGKDWEIIACALPFDFLLHTASGPIARERKEFPGDFIASVKDGRFAKECAAMREASQFPGIISEGSPLYAPNGNLIVGRKISRWSRKAVRNLIRSLQFIEGCGIEWSPNLQGTEELLRETQTYFDKTGHRSLRVRPTIRSSWLVTTQEERYLHWLQGLPSVGAGRAELLASRFPTPASMIEAGVEQIMESPNIGKTLAQGIWGFLHVDKIGEA